jgi:nucleotide-binding universal stress UspA family protein
MPKILVPIDFSQTSLNAAIYAAKFGKAISASRVTLFSVVSESITGVDGTPVGGDTDERDRAILHQLEELQVSLYEITGVPTSVELKAGDFGDIMARFMKEHLFDFVVMGVTGFNALEEVFGSSNTVDVIARTSTPVLVVPPEANFKEIKNVALAVELQHLDETLPMKDLDKWLHWLRPKVHIAHVNEGGRSLLTDTEDAALESLKEKLILFEPSTYLLNGDSFSGALNDLAQQQHIDMLFTFPHKHSFYNLLFRTTHTRKLVFHSKIPVLALPHTD